MSSRRRGWINTWIQKVRHAKVNPHKKVAEESCAKLGDNLRTELVPLHNPIEAYYEHRVQNHLSALYRFGIQTRSLDVRDVFAKAASNKRLGLTELLETIDNLSPDPSKNGKSYFHAHFDSPVLLVLADLLANTARNELDTYAAVQLYNFVYSNAGNEPFSNQQLLLYVEALNESGHYKRAQSLTNEHAVGELAPLQPELLELQRVRHTSDSLDEWARCLNHMYASRGLTQIRLLADESLAPMDRLAAERIRGVDGPKVSVIVPTYAPGPGIRTAIRGLVEQTWQNLEIIIVDDASPAQYRELFTHLGQIDPRIRVLHQKKNAGAYVARNMGLAVATGDFITTADDDDWSHPDKIASQVSILLEDPAIVATTSAHIRTTEQLRFRRVNSSARYVQMNYSSLMFRKQVVDEIGPWDSVNRGADSEFFTRAKAFYGADRVFHVSDTPLSFSRVWDGSLTSGEMYRGFIGTPRVLYLWAIRQWHWDLGKVGRKPIRIQGESRPYPVPTTLEAGDRNRDLGLLDVIYVTDFFRQAKYVDYVLNEIESLADSGFRVGYLHLDSPLTTSSAGLPRKLLDLHFEGRITQVSLEDVAETKLLIVYDSAIGMFTDQNWSRIKPRRGVVVERELPTLAGAPRRTPTNVLRTLKNLDDTFNTRFQIVGATDSDQRRVTQKVPASRVLPDKFIWHTHVRESATNAQFPREKAIVGFHSFGNKYRWPANSAAFQAVYCSESFKTRLFGQIEPAKRLYGEDAFKDIQIIDHDSRSTSEFLEGIDFWVYFPHPRLRDNVWEPVLSALRAGKVVVLPPHLSSIYGSAAVYADESSISSVISVLMQQPEAYKEQAMRGQQFVATRYTMQNLVQRVLELCVPPTSGHEQEST